MITSLEKICYTCYKYDTKTVLSTCLICDQNYCKDCFKCSCKFKKYIHFLISNNKPDLYNYLKKLSSENHEDDRIYGLLLGTGHIVEAFEYKKLESLYSLQDI